MIADIDAGLVGVVIAKDLSRIGRNYVQTGFYTEGYFRQKGVRFIAIGNGVDTINPISSEFAPFMNVLNEMYLRDQSKKMRAFFRQRGNSGLPTNTLCVYGYKKDPENKNHWVIDDEAAAVVKRIFQLAIDCHGPYEIARILSEDHVECPAYYNAVHDNCMSRAGTDMTKPYAWNGVTVTNILKRPEYMGHTINFRSAKNGLKAKRFSKSPDEWMVFENTHEAIVTQQDWELAQNALKARRRTDSNGEANPLTGKLFCAECGAMLNNHRSKARKTGRASDDYYDCPTYSQEKGNCCCHYVTTDFIRRICLQFDDIVDSGSGHSFSENMAKRITDFVRQLSGYVKELYVVCDSGESRSAAIAAAILQSRGENEETIWKNPGYHPNRLVYERLCKAFGNPVSTERCHELMVMNEAALAEKIEESRKGK